MKLNKLDRVFVWLIALCFSIYVINFALGMCKRALVNEVLENICIHEADDGSIFIEYENEFHNYDKI